MVLDLGLFFLCSVLVIFFFLLPSFEFFGIYNRVTANNCFFHFHLQDFLWFKDCALKSLLVGNYQACSSLIGTFGGINIEILIELVLKLSTLVAKSNFFAKKSILSNISKSIRSKGKCSISIMF